MVSEYTAAVDSYSIAISDRRGAISSYPQLSDVWIALDSDLDSYFADSSRLSRIATRIATDSYRE